MPSGVLRLRFLSKKNNRFDQGDHSNKSSLIGLGESKKIAAEDIRRAAASAVKEAKK